jgi:hypothetical protein
MPDDVPDRNCATTTPTIRANKLVFLRTLRRVAGIERNAIMRMLVIGAANTSSSRVDRTYRSDPTPLVAPKETDAALALRVVWRVVALVAFVFLTFPPCFSGIGAGLDESWKTGLHEVSSRHMVFGRDVAFTYGPLGFVIFPRDFGSHMLQTVFFRLGLHLFWWTAVGVLLFRIRGYVASFLFVFAAVLSGIHVGPTIWDLNDRMNGVTYLAAVSYLVLGHIDRRPIWGVPAAIISAAAILAKYSIGVALTGSLVVWAVVQLYREPTSRMLGRLAGVLLAYAAVLIGLFRIYGGPLGALGDFFRYSQQIAAAYSTQMSYPGPIGEVIVASALLGLFLVAAVAGVLRRASYAPVLLIILFPLFVLYKSAIVRHDDNHFLMACPIVAGLVALLLPGQTGWWRSVTTQAAVAGLLVALSWFTPSSVESFFTRGPRSLVGVCKYAQTKARIKALDANVRDQLKLPASFLAKIGSAPMDVYPWDISLASANGLNWKPRFVLQSYCAYTPILDLKSAWNYRREGGPEYIVYSYQSIDAQHPCIVDPRTLMEIYCCYNVVDQADGMLLLKRGAHHRYDWDNRETLGTKSVAFGERWEVPKGIGAPIILEANLKLSLLGRLASLLYKVYPPMIQVEYRDGPAQTYSLVWRNIKSGFVVSSLPRDLNGVRQFLEKGEAEPVEAVSFLGGGWCFETECQLSWSRSSPNLGSPPEKCPGDVAVTQSGRTTEK